MGINDGNRTGCTYDKLGNRTDVNENGTTTSYASNILNQYTSVGGRPYYYDENGNYNTNGILQCWHDCENRMTACRRKDQYGCLYKYDYAGRRVKKDKTTTYFVVLSTTKYCYDGDQVIAEYDGNDVLLRKFVYGPGIDEPICMIDVTDNNEVYYYHFDGLGSVRALSDASAAVVESYSYDVFGEPNRISSMGNPYLFTARRYDDEVGIYYYRARYYNPEFGRFLEPDPVYYSDGLNLYTYCHNNPINLVDPFGLGWWKDFWTPIWAARGTIGMWLGGIGLLVFGAGFVATLTVGGTPAGVVAMIIGGVMVFVGAGLSVSDPGTGLVRPIEEGGERWHDRTKEGEEWYEDMCTSE